MSTLVAQGKGAGIFGWAEWIFSAYTIIVALVWRIMGFRCYSGAADTFMSPQKKRPKACYQLNTDMAHDGFRDYRGSAFHSWQVQCCRLKDPSFSPFSLVFFTVPFCQVAHRRKSQMAVSAYWGKWTSEMTEADIGLSAGEDASKLSEGPLGRRW